MLKRSILTSPGVVVIVMILTTHSAIALNYCYFPNVGGWRDQESGTSIWGGVRSDVNVEDAGTVPNDQAYVHPMQVMLASGDFIGWGTVRGEGTNASGAISNCPDDYSSGWDVYIDGLKFDQYFCRRQYGEIGDNASNQLFTLRYGDCAGVDKWRAFLNGTRLTCQLVDGTIAFRMAVGAEVLGNDSSSAYIDVRYHNLERYLTATGVWYPWTNGYASTCADTPFYYVTVTAADDITVAENV